MPDLNLRLPCQNRVLFRLRFSVPLLIAIVSAGANAQSAACTPVQVDEAVARLHTIHKNPMEFQDYAEFRQLSGAKMGAHEIRMSEMSVFQIDIDTRGKTTAVKTISGMHVWSNAYANILNRISYVPFKENGEPVCVRYIYKIPPPEEKRASWDKFHSLIQRCTDLSRSGAGPAEVISACQQAADAGDSLPPPSYFSMDKRLAYVTTATALMRDNRAKEALPYAEKAVEIAALGFDDVSGKAAAYGVRGQARGLTGDLQGADQDLAKAEELERATFEVPRKPERKAFDTHALKSVLGFHAEVLTALGKKAEAEKLRDEAKKL
jgi:tetratricopeptide (TPR) repeat protein